MGKVKSDVVKKWDSKIDAERLKNFMFSKDAVKKAMEYIKPGEGIVVSEEELLYCAYWMSPGGEFLIVNSEMTHCEYVITNYCKFGYLAVEDIIGLLGIRRDIDVKELSQYDGIINKDVLARGWVKISYSKDGITIITFKKFNEWLKILKTVIAHLFMDHGISKSATVDIEFCKPDGAWDYGVKYTVGELLESCRRHKMTGVDEGGK